MKSAYRVCIITSDTLNFGGVETHILNLIRRSTKTEYLIVANTTELFKENIGNLNDSVQLVSKKPGFSLVYTLWRLRKRIDIIHIHSPGAMIIGHVSGMFIQKPIIVTEHLPALKYFGQRSLIKRVRNKVHRAICTLLQKHITSMVIFVSAKARNSGLQEGLVYREKSIVIPNGVMQEHFENRKIEFHRDLVCFWGRFDAQKNLHILIRAMAILNKHEKTCVCWLVGAGREKASLLNEIRLNNIGAHVKIRNYKKNIKKISDIASIFVLPSQYEAMSISLLEAMAAGLACVVTDVGENAHLIKDGVHGLVVPTENSEALAKAIKILLDNPTLRRKMGHAAREKARSYSDTTMTRRTEIVYLSTLKKKLSPRP